MDKMMRIRAEIPTFKRCCVCLPLRHGLLLWGYIRLVLGVILLIEITKGFLEMLRRSKEKEGYEVYLVMFGFFVILAGTDIVLNVVLVYAEHKKDLKMLRAYYIYSFVLWVLLIIMGVPLCVYAVYLMNLYEMDLTHAFYMSLDVANLLASILIQAYILLLVRSEFLKLSKNYEFGYVNNAAESACRMKYEEDNVGNGDKEAEDNMTSETNLIAIPDTVYDRETARRNILANGDKPRVNNNEKDESNHILIY